MVMDVAKTHNSTPPPGGGWVDAAEDEGSGSRRGEGGGSCRRSRSRRRGTTTTAEDLVPPDGGWGWIIVLGNCINSAVLNSLLACYGVMYLPLIALGYNNTQVASIPSVFISVTNLLGPLSTGLSHYYSARRLTLIGISIVVLGILLCSFYKNIVWFYLCFGVIGGLGNSLASPQGFLLGQKYFCHKRVTANGLSTVGASIGGMVFPPLINYFVETYALEGAFMLWAGLVLHGLIGGSLFHPVSWHLRHKRATDGSDVQQNGSQPKSDIPGNKIVVAGKVEDRKECNVFEDESVVKNLTPDKDDSDDSDHEELIITQDVLLDTHNQKTDMSENQCSERQWKNPLTDVLQTNEYLERPRTVSIERSMEILPQIPEESEDEDCFETYDPESGNERIEFLNRENDMRNRPISYISTKSVDSIVKIPSVESIFDSNDVLDQFDSALSFKVERLKDSADEADKERRKHRRSSSVGVQPFRPYIMCGLKVPRLQHIINFSILRHPIFIIAALASVCSRLVYICMMTYLPSYGYEAGIGSRSAYLLTIIATFELLGKVVMSVISDQGWLQRRYFYIMLSISSTISILCLTVAWDIVTLGICTGLYGFCVGGIMSIGPILMVEYLGLKLLPHSFGLMLFMNGVSGFALLPLTGVLSDITGSYRGTLFVVGCMALLPTFLWSLVPCFPQVAGEASKIPADNV